MTATAEDDAPPRWQDDLYALLRASDVTQFAYVPDAGHRILIDPEIQAQPRPGLVPRPFPRRAAVLR
jgi:hypothetical protein